MEDLFQKFHRLQKLMKVTYFASELNISTVEVRDNGERILLHDHYGRNLQLALDNDTVWVEWVVTPADRSFYRIRVDPADWNSFYKAAVRMGAEFSRIKAKKLERQRGQERGANSRLRTTARKFKQQLGVA
jgi:hypothetical protein